MIEILNAYTGAVLYSADVSDVRAAVLKAVEEQVDLRDANLSGANLRDANLRDANLSGADLSGANLSGANLRGADLRGADLRDANLGDANLRDANLGGANLGDANLGGADLRDANLGDANLRDANLGDANLRDAKIEPTTVLPTGETWAQYLSETLPALLQAGGKTIAEVASTWDCHQWDNCPMHAAFNAEGVSQCPILLRPRVEQFVQLFDARLIPCPVTPAEETPAAE